MEKCNLSIDVRALISNLLANGLEPVYNDIINFFNNENQSDPYECALLLIALDIVHEDSALLHLKMNEVKNQMLYKFLATPSFLQPQDDGYIHLSKLIPRGYYATTPEILNKIIFDDAVLPPQGQTGIYTEHLIFPQNDQVYKSIRQFKINSQGQALEVLSEVCTPIENRGQNRLSLDESTVYTGLLSDILNNANFADKDEPVTKDQL